MPQSNNPSTPPSAIAHLLPNLARSGPSKAFDWMRGQRTPKAKLDNQLKDILHGQSVINTFASPHGMNAGEMVGHLTEIWREEGFLPPDETLIRFNEKVIPGFKHDEKLKQAVRANFQQDPFTGFYSKDAGAVAQGLGHLFAVANNLPCTLVNKGDIGNLKGLNIHAQQLFETAGHVESKPSPNDPLQWKEPAWRSHVNDIMRVMLTRGTRTIEEEAKKCANGQPNAVIACRAGGDEVDILVVGIDKKTFDVGIKPELYKTTEEVSTSFGLTHLPHPKHQSITAQGIGFAAGTIDLNAPGRWNDKKNAAAMEAKLEALAMGTMRQYSQSPSWAGDIDEQFNKRLDGMVSSPTEKRRAIKTIERLADHMYISLHGHGDPRKVKLQQSGQRYSLTNRLERKMFHAADQLRLRHDAWGGRFRTALPVEPTPHEGYALRPVSPDTARSILAEREKLYKGISNDAIFAADYMRPFVPAAPADPFARRSKGQSPVQQPLFQPTWVDRQPRVAKHLRQHYPNLTPEQVQRLGASIASTPSIDPPTGLLMPDTFKAQIERWGHDTLILQRHASEQLALGDKATDKLLVRAMHESGSTPKDLRTFCLMIDTVGLTAMNGEAGNANADLWLGDLASRFVKTGHDQGLHITNGKERGNALACHAGAGRFMAMLPVFVERDGKAHRVTKHDALALGEAYVKDINALNGVNISTHLQELGGSSSSRLKYGQLVNKRAGAEKEVGIGAFVGATLVRLPAGGHNPGGQFFETMISFQDSARSRRLDTRYQNLPAAGITPTAAMKAIASVQPHPPVAMIQPMRRSPAKNSGPKNQ